VKDPKSPILQVPSKLTLTEERAAIPASIVRAVLERLFLAKGCSGSEAREVTEHLIETDLSGMESHGVMRALQYAEQYDSGYLRPNAEPRILVGASGVEWVDGDGGIGIPAMRMAVDRACDVALANGVSVLPVRNIGHTGRLGAFAERAGNRRCFVMIVGGGGRQNWRQVAPFGGRKAILPTNPYCFGIPGGERGSVVVDFATSVIAGGWVHAARAGGALLPEGALIDRDGHPSRDPQAYFSGGAILAKGGAMGYGLAVMAEMLCEAMLGPVTTEVNWLIVAIDTTRHRDPHIMQTVAEEILAELRECPPAPGFTKVQVPGERERDERARNRECIITLPASTWRALVDLAATLGIVPPCEGESQSPSKESVFP
jgi:LDH2 family malate/lactate/ureidoglycolate dehydrogenase